MFEMCIIINFAGLSGLYVSLGTGGWRIKEDFNQGLYVSKPTYGSIVLGSTFGGLALSCTMSAREYSWRNILSHLHNTEPEFCKWG